MVVSLKYFFASLIIVSAIIAANGQCLPIPRDCTFYRRCLEAAVPCGPSGYALGFGEPYCNKFRENYARFSAAGREWLWPTMDCLQRVLIPIANGEKFMTCPEIRSFAFASHSRCYTQPGQSICDLPFSDWMLLFVMISQELNDPATWQQMLEVLQTCLGNSAIGIN